jgi:hypothetical protein
MNQFNASCLEVQHPRNNSPRAPIPRIIVLLGTVSQISEAIITLMTLITTLLSLTDNPGLPTENPTLLTRTALVTHKNHE